MFFDFFFVFQFFFGGFIEFVLFLIIAKVEDDMLAVGVFFRYLYPFDLVDGFLGEVFAERIANPSLLPREIFLPAPLVVRESTKRNALPGKHRTKEKRK